MNEPVVLDDSALTELIGPIAKTSYEEGIRHAFDAAREAAGSSAGANRSAANAV
jgi:hypothetical protein